MGGIATAGKVSGEDVISSQRNVGPRYRGTQRILPFFSERTIITHVQIGKPTAAAGEGRYVGSDSVGIAVHDFLLHILHHHAAGQTRWNGDEF